MSKPSEGQNASGPFECYHCGSRAVYLQNDYSTEDAGVNNEGLVQIYYCQNCGAMIEYYIDLEPIKDDSREE